MPLAGAGLHFFDAKKQKQRNMPQMMALRVPKIKSKSSGAAKLGLWPQTVLATTPLNLDSISAIHFLRGQLLQQPSLIEFVSQSIYKD